MKITSVELSPENSTSTVVLSFKDPRRVNPYNVKAIIGLDADDIFPAFYGSTAFSKFYEFILREREIVVLIELNPSYAAGKTHSDLRDDLYRMISAYRSGIMKIRFKEGASTKAVLSGFVTKFEASHFGEVPEVQLTLTCSDPMLRAPNKIAVDPATLVELSAEVRDDVSTAPHGFDFSVDVLSARSDFIIKDPNDSWQFRLVPFGGFLAGDKINFSSIERNKYIELSRSGVITPLADVIMSGSIWPIMFPGLNVFSITLASAFSYTRLGYYPTYWGI